MTITWAQFIWAVGLFLIWNGFLVGIIKVLISREVKGFQARLEAAEKTATAAEKAVAAAVADQKQSMTEMLGTLRLEFTNKAVCGNHQRMEGNDEKLFGRLDQLHGDVRELLGGVKALANSVELLNTHHLNGGK